MLSSSKKEMDKTIRNIWKGALFCWRRRRLDNPVDNSNTCELNCACKHSPEQGIVYMKNHPERYMPPGTSLWDVIASSLLVYSRGKSYRPALIGIQIGRQSKADEIKNASVLSSSSLFLSWMQIYHIFCFFKEENQTVSAFNKHLSWRIG